METVLFYFFGTIALLSAASVVAQRRVMYSAISLIICLCALSGIYMLLKAPFIAAVQVIVYAGAIMVLFLFVIMLLDPFSATVFTDKRKYLTFLAIAMGSLTFILICLLLNYDLGKLPRDSQIATARGDIRRIGETLFNEYLLPFEVTSILILVAIIGAVILAKKEA